MIPKIPEGERLLSVHHGLYNSLQNWPDADKRMQEGAQHYGYSWCEVNLTADMIEELMDIHNYLILMRLRLDSLDYEDSNVLAVISTLEGLAETMMVAAADLPEFDGPTSAEWIGDA